MSGSNVESADQSAGSNTALQVYVSYDIHSLHRGIRKVARCKLQGASIIMLTDRRRDPSRKKS